MTSRAQPASSGADKLVYDQAVYREYLNQDTYWPSSSQGLPVLIDSMHPAQAINSYHRLVAGMDNRDDIVNRLVYDCPLAMALLTQAVGEKVSYTADIVEMQVMHVPAPEPSIEECFDILGVLYKMREDNQHPVSRARKLQDLIHLALTNQEIR